MKKEYVNKFSVAVSKERSEVIIACVQESPDLNALTMPHPGETVGPLPSHTNQELVADLIMSEKTARRLAEVILQTLDRTNAPRITNKNSN